MEKLKGISLIVLVITIIVMIIIAGAIIISLTNTNIKEIALLSMVFTENGSFDQNKTYDNVKSQLQQIGFIVENLQADGKFVVVGKDKTYEVKIEQLGVTVSIVEGALDGLQGEYLATHYLDNEGRSYINIQIDGQGKAVQTTRQADGTNQVVEFDYTYDKANNKIILEMNGYILNTLVYQLPEYNNKIIISQIQDGEINENIAIVFTTNGLEGIRVEGLVGKTYKCIEKDDKITFNDSELCSTGYYFTLPHFEINNQDKIVIGQQIYTLGRNESDEIIRIIEEGTGYIYEYQP